MNRPKRLAPFIAVAVVVAAAAAGTYYYASHSGSNRGSGLKVVATFYPLYDFTRNVGGDKIDLSVLVPEAVDVHAFEPTPSTIQAVATADVLIYNGAGLEPWIGPLIAAANNPHLVAVNSSRGIAILPVSPQFQRNNRTVDPHVWLDPINAKQQVSNILSGLVQADPADSTYFTINAQDYAAELDFLNRNIVIQMSSPMTRYFVTFHEAFAYFAKRYNLTQIPIAGPFGEEPTPSEIQAVVNAIHAYHLCYVGYESLENPAIAQAIASQTNATLIPMDPIEGLSQTDQVRGKTYLLKMYDDLSIFVLALNHVGCS